MDSAPIDQSIVIGDGHSADAGGLMHKDGILLDDGQPVLPSPAQHIVYAWWEEMRDEWIPEVTQGEPFAVVFNGDMLEGDHHRSKSAISLNHNIQQRAALRLYEPIRDLCGGRLYMTRGSRAHSGDCGEHEESLARALGAIPDAEGRHARWDLNLRIGGRLANIRHTISTSNSPVSEQTALSRVAVQMNADSALWGWSTADWIVRSHAHRFTWNAVASKGGLQHRVTVPGWQLKTPFMQLGKIDTYPQFGAVLLRVEKNGELTVKSFVRSISPSPEVVL